MRKHGQRAQTSIPVGEIGAIAGSDPIAIDVVAFFSACATRHAVLAIAFIALRSTHHLRIV